MSRSPAHLVAAAVALRAVAAALTADFDGLSAHTGPATWEGPAASACRTRSAALARDAGAVVAELLTLAARLDDHAAVLVAADEAAATRVRQRAALGEVRSDG